MTNSRTLSLIIKNVKSFSLLLSNFLHYYTLGERDTLTLGQMDIQTLGELDYELIE